MLNRIDLLQKILDSKKGKTYLEIGIYQGACFVPIRSEMKIGVDIVKPAEQVTNILDDKTKYFQMTSDEFFEKNGNIFSTRKIDVAFIDGFHSFKQSLTDVENCLKYLDDKGVIVLHDCNPTSAKLAEPYNSIDERFNAGHRGGWTGDVWKTIVYLRSLRDDLNVMVLDIETGLGVITKGKPENMLKYSLKSIERIGYEELAAKRNWLLNLKGMEYIKGLFRGIEL